MVIPAMAGPSWRSAWAEPRSVPSFAPLPLPAPPSWTQKIVSRTVPRGIPQRGRERTGTGVKFPSTSYFFSLGCPFPPSTPLDSRQTHSFHPSLLAIETLNFPLSSRSMLDQRNHLLPVSFGGREGIVRSRHDRPIGRFSIPRRHSPVDRCANLAADRANGSLQARPFDGSTTSSAVNGSRCDRICRGEGASERRSKGQKRERRGTGEMKGEGASEAGDREEGVAGAEEKRRNERKDAGNGSRILTNWKAVKPKAQRRAPRWFRKRASMFGSRRREGTRSGQRRHF